MKKKFLSIRINTQTNINVKSKTGKTFRSFESQQKHNLRIEKMDNFYLKNENLTKENIHYNFLKKKKNDNLTWKDLETSFLKMEEDYKNHNKRKMPSNTKKMLNGLITFSDTMQKDLEKFGKKKLAQECFNFIKQEFGEVISLDLHLDETTPHIHFNTLNWNFKEHKTHSRLLEDTLKKSKNRKNEMQDRLADFLKSRIKDFDYVRGIEKGPKKDLEQRKKYQEQIGRLEKENNDLISKNNDLIEKQKEQELKNKIIIKERENIMNELSEIVSDIIAMGELDKGLNMLKMAKRYLDKEQMKKFDNLQNKAKRTRNAIIKANNKNNKKITLKKGK